MKWKEKLFEEALILIERDGANNVSISELASKTNISRMTFYRHFKSLNDVIEYKVNTLFADKFDIFTADENKIEIRKMISMLIDLFEKEQRWLVILAKENKLKFLGTTYFKSMEKALGIDKEIISKRSKEQISLTYLLAGFNAGLFKMIVFWLRRKDISKNELIELLVKFSYSQPEEIKKIIA